MTDDLLTTFRSEMPMPDEETTQRTYERATSGRRRLATRNRLVAVAVVLALAGIAGGLTATLGGGSSLKPWKIGAGGGAASGKISLNPLSTEFTAAGAAYDSIDVSLLSVDNATALELRVVRSDAADVADADSAASTVVFDDQVSMSDDGNPEDGSYTTWSGTLTPSEWNGGCQEALYRIEYHFADSDLYGSSGWFQCSGPKVDAADPFLY
jgi:hypothetical protein